MGKEKLAASSRAGNKRGHLTAISHSAIVISRVRYNLDKPLLNAAQIAELAQTDIVNIHTWTTRGFTDPYHTKPHVRRGRGRMRSYSIRDALRFFLMARLHSQYRTPLPQGLQICQSVFGEENFNPQKAGYLVLEEGPSGSGGMRWYENLKVLGQHLTDEPVSLVINVRHILGQVESGASQLLVAAHPEQRLGER